VAAHAKFYGKRQTRLLALLTMGESLAAAARAVNVSCNTVNRHRRADPVFAEAVRAAREQRVPELVVEVPDWRVIAAQLEREHPERWALPGGDPFDFDPQA
jgi:hypothetical protein